MYSVISTKQFEIIQFSLPHIHLSRMPKLPNNDSIPNTNSHILPPYFYYLLHSVIALLCISQYIIPPSGWLSKIHI